MVAGLERWELGIFGARVWIMGDECGARLELGRGKAGKDGGTKYGWWEGPSDEKHGYIWTCFLGFAHRIPLSCLHEYI